MQFFNGSVAMIPCGGWLKSEMQGKIPGDFELGSFNIPSVGAKAVVDTSAINGGSNPYFVMAKSKHPREAVDFLRFMTSRTMAAKFSQIQDIPSVIRGASEGNLSKDLSDIVTMMGAAKTTFGSVPGEGYPELEQVWNDAMRRLVTPGGTTPEKLAEELEKAAATVRNRAANPDRITVKHYAKPLLLLAALAIAAAVAIWSLVTSPRHGRKSVAPVATLPRMSWVNVLLFVGPAALLYATFVIFPSFRSFSWSLHDWNGLTDMAAMPFKGLLHFRRLLFESDAFWIALSNNLFIMIVVPLFVIPFSLLVASCISRGIVGAKFFRVVFFFPSLLGAVAVALLWVNVYNPSGGLLNEVLAPILEPLGPKVVSLANFLSGTLGMEWFGARVNGLGLWMSAIRHFPWLSPDNLYWALIPISIWGACGFNIVLYLAAMESVPQDFYEAATIDGASPVTQFFTITIPLIWDVLAISIVFMVIGGMKAFDLIWLLTNQRPPTESHVVATRMIQTMFDEFRVGEAAAVAVLLFLMVFLGSAATLRIMKRDTVEL
jgi:raffinose/stachyose/melibiose transport system permease protein